MLRRRARFEILTALFFEAGRRGHGRPERDAGVFAARRGCYPDAKQKAARRAVSARRGRRLEYRRAFWRTKLLSHASDDRHSAAQAWRPGFGVCTCKPRLEYGCGNRPGRLFRSASEPRAPGAALSQETTRHRAFCPPPRTHALALRRAGLHGIGHAGLEVDRRRLAQPCSRNRSGGELFALPRRRDGAEPPAHAAWRSASHW